MMWKILRAVGRPSCLKRASSLSEHPLQCGDAPKPSRSIVLRSIAKYRRSEHRSSKISWSLQAIVFHPRLRGMRNRHGVWPHESESKLKQPIPDCYINEARIKSGTMRGPSNATIKTTSHGENQTCGRTALINSVTSLNFLGLTLVSTGLQADTDLFLAAIRPFFGLIMVFVGGAAYAFWYRRNVIKKMEKAFMPSYEPALLDHRSKARRRELQHPHRGPQLLTDQIISAQKIGQYWMLLGPKGAGKSTMILDAMSKFDADGLAYVEAHPDLEIFRLRIGKALNYKFNEDSQTLLFKRKDPREGGPVLDIERALSKLERVALRLSRSRRRNKPLVFIFNNVHHFQHTDEGRNVLLQLQQRAETWAENRIMTMVFISDDFWPYAVMNRNACAGLMRSLTIEDLNRDEALQFARHFMERDRKGSFSSPHEIEEIDRALNEALTIVGGRISFIMKLCDDPEKGPGALLSDAKNILRREKAWLLNNIGLIPQLEGQLTSEQILSVNSWTLLRRLVDQYDSQIASMSHKERKEKDGFTLPSLPFCEAREIMTRSEFIYELDRNNIIAIDVDHNIRPDSNLVLRAAREVIQGNSFEERLEAANKHIQRTMKKNHA